MRQGIGLRGFAQKDPLVEYRSEGTLMFDEMNGLIKQEVVRNLMHAEITVEEPPAFEQQASQPGNLHYLHEDAASLEAIASGALPTRGAGAADDPAGLLGRPEAGGRRLVRADPGAAAAGDLPAAGGRRRRARRHARDGGRGRRVAR